MPYVTVLADNIQLVGDRDNPSQLQAPSPLQVKGIALLGIALLKRYRLQLFNAVITVDIKERLVVMAAIAIGVTPQMVRLARSRTLSIKEEPFVMTIRATGVSSSRIILKHILPHTASPILAYATGYVGIALIAESALHFLGLGVPPPQPSWGGILQEGRAYIEAAPWLAVFPGMALSATAFSFVFVGDALRDLLDLRERRI